ncbi:MAG TPA: outer membrane beta-barrel domain-containing protein [Cellvibrionales bacterium]|jgi:outer membrane beta-barrel protein|nr:outer membrane beta-barrel domain-containing protein [Cellvibrionales bacterium]
MAYWLQRLLLIALSIIATLSSIRTAAEVPEVISPEIDRREIKVARIDNENIEVGIYGGILAIEDFDSSNISIVRIDFHINEHTFIEASYGSAKGDTTTFEELIPSTQLISDEQREYTSYDISFGWNIFPGETWLRNKAYKSDFYLILGGGSTEFGGDKWFTWNVGAGYRLFLNDWLAWRIDVRDHIFNRDLFGEDDQTNNIEMSSGVSFFF